VEFWTLLTPKQQNVDVLSTFNVRKYGRLDVIQNPDCTRVSPVYINWVGDVCVDSEQYGRRIQEQENLGKALRDRQKVLRDNQDTSVAQMRMWRDIERLLECKLRLAGDTEAGSRPAAAAAAAHDEDRLVL